VSHFRGGPPPLPIGNLGHVRGVGFAPGAIGTGLFVLVVVVALVVLVVLLLARRRDREAGGLHAHAHSDALSVLNERLARGEIDPEDYSTRRTLLQGPT
jgi:putative membrane protein